MRWENIKVFQNNANNEVKRIVEPEFYIRDAAKEIKRSRLY